MYPIHVHLALTEVFTTHIHLSETEVFPTHVYLSVADMIRTQIHFKVTGVIVGLPPFVGVIIRGIVLNIYVYDLTKG